MFVRCFCREESNEAHWYKFDDTDVSDCKMEDDEELRSQCFGGDYPAQSFEQPIMKRYRGDKMNIFVFIIGFISIEF